MSGRPQATVAAIVTTTDNGVEKILLTLRAVEPFKGMWCLPGGHIDQNEAAEHAVIREVKEETGLEFRASFFKSFDEILPENGIHAVVSVYKGQGTGTPQRQLSEVEHMEWFSLDEALSLPLGFEHRTILKEYAMNNDKPGKGILAEFSALRDEILKRIEMRQTILVFALGAASTLLTLAVTSKAEFWVLLPYPFIAALLALVWMQNDVRIGELGEYITKELGKKCEDLKGFEDFLRQNNAKRGWKGGWRDVEVAALGVFLITEFVSMILAALYLWKISVVWTALFLVLAICAIIWTFYSIRCRRKRLEKPPAPGSDPAN